MSPVEKTRPAASIELSARRICLRLMRRFTNWGLFSFRMIGDTQIECRNANSQGEAAWFGPAGRNWGGAEPGSSGAVGLDGFLSSLRQRGPHLPPLRHQSPDVLSLAAPL